MTHDDEVILYLLALYAGGVIINSAIAATLWRSTRDSLFRALFLVWAASILPCAQGMFVGDALTLTLAFSPVFLTNFAFAHLLAATLDVPLRWRLFVAIFGLGLAGSVVAFAAGGSLLATSLPTCAAVATPVLVTAWKVYRTRWDTLKLEGRALVLSCVLFSAHNVDYALLRDDPRFATLGFFVALLLVFAISVIAPAVVLRVVTERHARLAMQLELARGIQARLLPREPARPGLDYVTHLRPADSVAGDYLDVLRIGDAEWFLLGDVTGHGIDAGMLMLMAQSTISSIIEARPDVSPRELNHVANQALCRNLARLGERRHVTLIAIRREADRRLTVSGSEEKLLVYRAAMGQVETIMLRHFPFGLGFGKDLAAEDIEERSLDLAQGDVLFAATDGVFEAARQGNPRLGYFGANAVADVLCASASLPLPQIRANLLADLDRFTGGMYLDDLAFLLMRAERSGCDA